MNYNQIALQRAASIYTPTSNSCMYHLQHLALFSFSIFCQYNNHKIMYHFSSHLHVSYYWWFWSSLHLVLSFWDLLCKLLLLYSFARNHTKDHLSLNMSPYLITLSTRYLSHFTFWTNLSINYYYYFSASLSLLCTNLPSLCFNMIINS